MDSKEYEQALRTIRKIERDMKALNEEAYNVRVRTQVICNSISSILCDIEKDRRKGAC